MAGVLGEDLTCGNCRFWEEGAPSVAKDWGECRRGLPHHDEHGDRGTWPVTHGDEWCGWHERKAYTPEGA